MGQHQYIPLVCTAAVLVSLNAGQWATAGSYLVIIDNGNTAEWLVRGGDQSERLGECLPSELVTHLVGTSDSIIAK